MIVKVHKQNNTPKASNKGSVSNLIDYLEKENNSLENGGFFFGRTNDDEIFSYEINFRHDIPNSNWAWGGSIEDEDNSDNLRLDQINAFNFDSVFASVFIEHKDVFGLTVRGALNNLLNRSERFVRTNFVNRRDGPIDFTEDRSRKFGLIYQLTVSGSF